MKCQKCGFEISPGTDSASLECPECGSACSEQAPEENKNKVFEREDYLPFMFGVFVIAGLIVAPFMYDLFFNIPKGRLIFISLALCAVFAYAFKRNGNVNYGHIAKALLIIIVLLYSNAKITEASDRNKAFLRGLQSRNSGSKIVPKINKNMIIPGMLLGFMAMAGGGWLGIRIGRATGITKRLTSNDRSNSKEDAKSKAPASKDAAIGDGE